MKPISNKDDIDALKEELELSHSTITQHRQQLEKATEALQAIKLNKAEEESLLVKNEEATNTDFDNMDPQILKEQLEDKESMLASLSNELNLLKEQLQEKRNEVQSIGEERDKLQTEKDGLSASLNELRKDLASLNASTLDLMEEYEISQSDQQEQRVEIESLKKVCLVEGDAKDEIIRLKTIMSGRYICFFNHVYLCQKIIHFVFVL